MKSSMSRLEIGRWQLYIEFLVTQEQLRTSSECHLTASPVGVCVRRLKVNVKQEDRRNVLTIWKSPLINATSDQLETLAMDRTIWHDTCRSGLAAFNTDSDQASEEHLMCRHAAAIRVPSGPRSLSYLGPYGKVALQNHASSQSWQVTQRLRRLGVLHQGNYKGNALL